MQNNAQNNWKERLDNTEALPGEILRDKNGAWEKLHKRLRDKPTRKFIAWYAAAAACIVVATTAAIMFLIKEKHQPFSPVAISSPTNKPSNVLNNAITIEQKNGNNVLLGSKEKGSRMMSSSRQKNITLKKQESLSRTNVTDNSFHKELTAETPDQPIVQIDSLREITTATPVKKKLRVVHINDLGQPMEESTAEAEFAERHRFPLRIINSDNYSPVSASPASNGIILFKSKSISN